MLLAAPTLLRAAGARPAPLSPGAGVGAGLATRGAGDAPRPGRGRGRVVLHVGPHKTGSTAIQKTLQRKVYQDSLASDGYLQLNWRNETLVDNALHWVLARCFNGACPPVIRRQLGRARDGRRDVLLSSEQFDRYATAADHAKIQRFFRGFGAIDVDVLVVYRRFYEWILSYYS